MTLYINYLAVLVAAVVNFGLGALWYSPLLFGKKWMELMGKTKEEISGAGKAMMWSFVAALAAAYVLALVVDLFGSSGFGAGAAVGFWMWFGFALTTSFVTALYEGRAKGIFLIYAGYQLAAYLLMGGILGMWR